MPSRAEWSASSAGFAGAILRLLASDGRAPAPRRPAARTASGGGFGRGAEPPPNYLVGGEGSENPGLEEPDQPCFARGPLGQIDKCRPSFLERKSRAVASTQETSEECPQHRLVAHDGHRGLARLTAEGGQNRVDAAVGEGRLDAGLDALEGARGNVRGGARAGKRAGQQHVGSVGKAGQTFGSHTELGLALRREGAIVIGNARRPAGDGSSVTNDQEPHGEA